jgi:hypothetical protein
VVGGRLLFVSLVFCCRCCGGWLWTRWQAKVLTAGLSLLEFLAALAANVVWLMVVACFTCLRYFAAVVVAAVDSAASKRAD